MGIPPPRAAQETLTTPRRPWEPRAAPGRVCEGSAEGTPRDGPLGPRATRQGRYLSLQAGGVQDGDPGPTAGPHGLLQAQQGSDGPRPHWQARGRTLQVPGDASCRERKPAGQQGGGGQQTGRAPQPSGTRPPGAQPGSRLLPAPALAPRQPLLPSVVPPAPPSSSPLSHAFTPHARRLAGPRAQGYGGRNKSDTHPALKKTPPGRQDQKVNQQLPHKGPGPSGQAGTDGLEHH